MDPSQHQPPPSGELASTLAPTNQVVNATTGINIATSDQAASTRITPAPAGDGTLAEGAIVVNSSDSPLSVSSEERVRYSHWDDLGMSYSGSLNLKHGQSPPSASRDPSRDPEQLHPHRRLGRRLPTCRPPRYKTARTSQVVPTTRHMRIGSAWQELVRRGVSKDSGARIKIRLGKPSWKSCSRERL